MEEPFERLRIARTRAGYRTATAAAEAFGWPVSTYLGHENGSRGLPTEAAMRYAAAFGISWPWLVSGAEDEPELISGLWRVPVAGILDPGAFRQRGFIAQDLPKFIHFEVFGYKNSELEAFAVYGSSWHDLHFVISSTSGVPDLRTGDEIILEVEQGDKVEVAAWSIQRGAYPGPTTILKAAYAPHVSIDPYPLEIVDEPGSKVRGVVVAEVRMKSRAPTARTE